MQTQNTGLRAAIRNTSAVVQEAASKSEIAALDVVDRADAAFGKARATWSGAREFGNEVAQSLDHAGRTTLSGMVEFNGALGRYGRDVLTDALEVGRKTIAARAAKEVVELYVDYISRRSRALFASIDELNAIAQAKASAAWSPMGETLRKTSEKSAA